MRADVGVCESEAQNVSTGPDRRRSLASRVADASGTFTVGEFHRLRLISLLLSEIFLLSLTLRRPME